MKEIKDTAKARMLRAEMAGDGSSYRYCFCDIFKLAKVARILYFKEWYPELCSHPLRLRIYFRDPEKEVSTIAKIVTGYLQILSGPLPSPRVGVSTDDGFETIHFSKYENIVKIETADQEEGGVLLIRPEFQSKFRANPP